MDDNETTGVAVDRRGLLAALATGGTGLVAGCASILGDGSTPEGETPDAGTPNGETPDEDTSGGGSSNSPTPTPTSSPTPEPPVVDTGFESGSIGDALVDASQDAVSPEVTDEYSHSGSHSLLLASNPGTSSGNVVASADPVTAPVRARVAVNVVRMEGDECSLGLRFVDTDSGSQVGLTYSEWHGEHVRLVEKDKAGDTLTEQALSGALELDSWETLELTLDGDGRITAAMADDETTLEPELDWPESSVKFELRANAWGSGHPITAAYDDVTVDELAGQ